MTWKAGWMATLFRREQNLESAGLETRTDLLPLLPVGGIGAELGVSSGSFSEAILNASPLGHLYSIDAWAGDRAHDTHQYKNVIKRLFPHRQRNSILRMRFDEAVDLFPDNYFDFIYVDGYAHTGEESGQTFHQYYPKLKAGGVLAGDDYCSDWPLVVRFVDEFVASHKLSLKIIPGRGMRIDPDVEYPDYPNWYVVKPVCNRLG